MQFKALRGAAASLFIAALAACGGGGSDDTTPISITAPVTGPITTPVTANALSVEVEPNNGSVANPLTPSVPLTGQLSSATDQDWYAVKAESAGSILIDFMTV